MVSLLRQGPLPPLSGTCGALAVVSGQGISGWSGQPKREEWVEFGGAGGGHPGTGRTDQTPDFAPQVFCKMGS